MTIPVFETCPRCGRNTLRSDRPALNALSRHVKDANQRSVDICAQCGTEEALVDSGMQAAMPWHQPVPGQPEQS